MTYFTEHNVCSKKLFQFLVYLSQMLFSCTTVLLFLLKPLSEVIMITNWLVIETSVIYSYFLFWSFPSWNFSKVLHLLLVFWAAQIVSLFISPFLIFSKIENKTKTKQTQINKQKKNPIQNPCCTSSKLKIIIYFFLK